MGCRTRGTVGDALLLERLLCVLLLELAAGPLGTEPVPFLTTGRSGQLLDVACCNWWLQIAVTGIGSVRIQMT